MGHKREYIFFSSDLNRDHTALFILLVAGLNILTSVVCSIVCLSKMRIFNIQKYMYYVDNLQSTGYLF